MDPARLIRAPFWRATLHRAAPPRARTGEHIAGGALGRYLPQGRAGQIAAICLTCLALAIVWCGAVIPARQWYAGRQMRLNTARRLLASERDLVASLPAMKARLAAAEGHAAHAAASGTGNMHADRLLLPGPSDAVAGAALQGDLQTLAQQSGINFDSAETLAGRSEGALRRIPLRVRLTTSYPKFVGLVTAIATSRPLMLVDRLEIHATSVPDAGASNSGTNLPLTAELTVSGFRVANARQSGHGQ